MSTSYFLSFEYLNIFLNIFNIIPLIKIFLQPSYSISIRCHIEMSVTYQSTYVYRSILAFEREKKNGGSSKDHPVYNIKSLLYPYYVIRHPIKIYIYTY